MKKFLIGLLALFSYSVKAQLLKDVSESIHGNFEVDAQYYNKDTAIGAPIVPQKILSNGFGNLNYIRGNFSAGLRFESYNPVMLGFDPRYQGTGIPYKYARYKNNFVDITAGNFYDQFGSGMILRIYENRGLLYDNTIEGFRAIITPLKGVTVKAMIGRQRVFFGLSPGIVRGGDVEWNLNETFDSLMAHKKTKVTLGGSFVSKYQTNQSPTLNEPENVGCFGGRANINHGGFNIYGEYAYKINDPSYVNRYNFKDGQGAYLTTSYAGDGFSIMAAGKYVDNMSYRSDRDQTLNAAMINYMPALTKYHTYLMATFYPYATQPNGEMAAQGEFQYHFKKGSAIGGKYGMEVALNASVAYGLDTVNLAPQNDARQFHYYVRSLRPGEKYFHDFNIEISKKINKKVKGTFLYSNQFYNKDIIVENSSVNIYPNIKTNIFVLDVTYKYKTGSSIRFEAQEMYTKQDKGSWAVGMIEWWPVSKFFAAVVDQWNYGNDDPSKRFHYYLFNIGFIRDAVRVTLSYGKQRQGIFCVGGVCRTVPASDGVALTVTATF
ncbi:MAG: hypothetical protein JST67_04210 [Bacteroidetes bacterium]|nr:hypothetical protein [Bacteroidota bacterium]